MSDNADIKDPVCGRPVDPLRARAVGIYGGVTRYFCSPECKARFADPRRGSGEAPAAGERRLLETEPRGDGTGDWFERGAVSPAATVGPPDRFEDLEGAAPSAPMPPSPSLLVEVEGVRRRRVAPLVVLVLVVAGVIVALLSRT